MDSYNFVVCENEVQQGTVNMEFLAYNSLCLPVRGSCIKKSILFREAEQPETSVFLRVCNFYKSRG